MNRQLLAGTAIAALASAAAPALAAPAATIASGTLAGQTVNGVNEFLGVPYAAPPVGNLRFAPPAAPASWTGLRNATRFSASCVQPRSIFGTPSANEDCLYLNVYAPASSSTRRPVMLWIHGGAFSAGEGFDYDGSSLVRNGNVVVVTINYRLGPLGFLTAPSLDQISASGQSGNYGLMDQQFAMQWVRRNIASFGGDPNNVTLFGESAGGASIVDHLASPTAKGLFDKGIIESGTYSPTIPTLSASEQNPTVQLLEFALGCGTSPTVACLRAAPASGYFFLESLVTARFDLPTALTFGPVLAKPVLPALPIPTIQSGAYNDVPVIDGVNHDEFRLFTGLTYDLQGPPLQASDYQSALAAEVPSLVVGLVQNQYPLSKYPSPDVALSTALTDGGFSCGASVLDTALAATRAPYTYEFNDPNARTVVAPPASFPYLDSHTTEIGYLFPTFTGIETGYTENFSSAQAALSLTMQKQWAAFATTGSPNGPGLPRWPAYGTIVGNRQSLTTPAEAQETGFVADHQCGFWNPLLALQIALDLAR